MSRAHWATERPRSQTLSSVSIIGLFDMDGGLIQHWNLGQFPPCRLAATRLTMYPHEKPSGQAGTT
jgi:hypothetical protein